MSKKVYEESNIQAIANAIREKNGAQSRYTTTQMANAVRAIRTKPVLEELTVTENGNYLPSAGKDGFSSVTVNVESTESVIQPLTITQNGTYDPPSGVDGYAPVTVNVSGGSGTNSGENVSLVAASNVSIAGTCVSYRGVCRAHFRADFSGSITKVFSIPEEYKPKLPAVFHYGCGTARTSDEVGIILPSGETSLFITLNNGYRYLSCEWFTAGTLYPVINVSDKISSIAGGILLLDNVAILSVYVNMSAGSNVWEDIIKLPDELKPTTQLRPAIHACVRSFYTKDAAYQPTTGVISAIRSGQASDNNILIQDSWIVE